MNWRKFFYECDFSNYDYERTRKLFRRVRKSFGKTWTTLSGREIPYIFLKDEHLENIGKMLTNGLEKLIDLDEVILAAGLYQHLDDINTECIRRKIPTHTSIKIISNREYVKEAAVEVEWRNQKW